MTLNTIFALVGEDIFHLLASSFNTSSNTHSAHRAWWWVEFTRFLSGFLKVPAPAACESFFCCDCGCISTSLCNGSQWIVLKLILWKVIPVNRATWASCTTGAAAMGFWEIGCQKLSYRPSVSEQGTQGWARHSSMDSRLDTSSTRVDRDVDAPIRQSP